MKVHQTLGAFTALSALLVVAGCGAQPSVVENTTTNSNTEQVTNTQTKPTPETPNNLPTEPTTNPQKPTATTPAPGKTTLYGVSGSDRNGSVTVAYSNALKQYKNSGFYYHFVNCHGSPGIIRMKVGARYMLDNRDNAQHRIVLGNTTFVLPAYGYIIASAPATLGTQHFVCDGGGAALISVEK